MQIKSIYIKNFKAFTEETFGFSSKFTLLIGDNGSGKTSVLEALSVGLGGYLAGVDGVAGRNIFPEEVRRETAFLGDATPTSEPQFPVVITCVGEVNQKEVSWTRTLNGDNGKTTHKLAEEITSYAGGLQKMVRQNNNEVILPVVAYMSERRTWAQKKEKKKDLFDKEEISRFLGYTDCLDAESNIKLFLRWFRRMQFAQIQKNRQIGELSGVIEAVKSVMCGLLETEDVDFYYDISKEEVTIDIDKVSLPLNMMSAGYQVVIGMVADLAYRMALLNPHLKERAPLETPGVVLIDELDLHLHPKWQWKIVNVLKNTFPLVQFITTTHSPIIISSCKENELIYLHEEDGEFKDTLLKNPYGWLVEDVLTGIMGTNERSPEIKKQIQRVRALYLKRMTQGLTQEEQAELQRTSNFLQEILPEGDPAVMLAKMDAIEDKLFRK